MMLLAACDSYDDRIAAEKEREFERSLQPGDASSTIED
jgi:hypothetical protein